MNGDELYKIIVAANIELQNLLSLLLSIYANGKVPGSPPNVLHALLSNHIPSLKTAIKEYARKKVFDTNECKAIRANVNAEEMDSSLLLSILLKVKEIIGIDRKLRPAMPDRQ